MFQEFLHNNDSVIESAWYSVMPGVKACRFATGPLETPVELPVTLNPTHFEALYCCTGALTLSRKRGSPLTVNSQELFLLSDVSSVRTAQISSPVSGILVEVDGFNALESLSLLSHLLGDLELYVDQAKELMAEREGCALLRSTPWSHHIFTALESMSAEEQGRYCTLKMLDLLYLLCTHSPLLEQGMDASCADSYLVHRVAEMRTYMETHLEEKLTIEEMSRIFHISPTTFKSNFRRLYGQSVHKWLQGQRIKKAAELLRTTPMTILQAAQSVGYEGVSQFNVAFKAQYGITPRQYRKMSITREF